MRLLLIRPHSSGRSFSAAGKESTMHYCNPINVDYKYQFIRPNPVFAGPDAPAIQISREAADPSMILFQGRYYIFASMTLSVWVSDDLVHWDSHPLPKELPLYDYAPDVTVVDDYVYFCASRRGVICDFYRTRDILNGPMKKSREPLISGILLCLLMMTEDFTSTMAATAQLRSTE